MRIPCRFGIMENRAETAIPERCRGLPAGWTAPRRRRTAFLKISQGRLERTEDNMSASREKQSRRDFASSGQISPKTAREAQQQKEERRSRILYSAIGIAFCVIVAFSVVWNSNILARFAAAVTIDGQKYTAAQVDFYYRTAYMNFANYWNSYGYLSIFGLDTNTSLESQEISATASSMLDVAEGTTWAEYFLDQGIEQMASVQNGLKQASEEGFEFPESVEEDVQENEAALKSAAEANGVSERRYLQGAYGSAMTEGVYRTEMRRLLQYQSYISAYQDSLTYTEEELEAYYEENARDYDVVTYEAVIFSGTAPSTQDDEGNTVEPTEEESATAKEAANTSADALLDALNNAAEGETLQTLSADSGGSYYGETTSPYETISDYTSAVLADWLFDDARQAGDAEVLESGSDYVLGVYHDRGREDTKTVDVRHILIQPETGTLSSEDEGYEEEQAQLKEAAKAKAEELYAQWQAGEATEESFAALAEEESSDTGSNTNGGLYEEVHQGMMVAAFNDWCFDPARKSGDTGIVETSYGYHIMYFVGDNIPYWQVQTRDALKEADYTAWVEAFHEDADIVRGSFGMSFVG